jgi:predicted molibdopterin-dependent oxidoreductase YjgC
MYEQEKCILCRAHVRATDDHSVLTSCGIKFSHFSHFVSWYIHQSFTGKYILSCVLHRIKNKVNYVCCLIFNHRMEQIMSN